MPNDSDQNSSDQQNEGESQDVDKIKEKGFEESDFTEKTSRDELVLKRVNGYCMFVEIKQGIASCSIYDARPKVCREYVCVHAGEEDCKLKRHYSVVDVNKL